MIGATKAVHGEETVHGFVPAASMALTPYLLGFEQRGAGGSPDQP